MLPTSETSLRDSRKPDRAPETSLARNSAGVCPQAKRYSRCRFEALGDDSGRHGQLGTEIGALANASVLKLRRDKTALLDCPVGYPLFGPGVEEITEPEGISGEIVTFQHERRSNRHWISQVTGADFLEI